MGAAAAWDAAAHSVNVTGGLGSIRLTPGKATAVVNNFTIPIDTDTRVIPLIANGHILLPLRFVAESPGATVSCNRTAGTVTITCLACQIPGWDNK